MIEPPLIWIVCPVTHPASSEASQTTAAVMSAGTPVRPTGMLLARAVVMSGSGMPIRPIASVFGDARAGDLEREERISARIAPGLGSFGDHVVHRDLGASTGEGPGDALADALPVPVTSATFPWRSNIARTLLTARTNMWNVALLVCMVTAPT